MTDSPELSDEQVEFLDSVFDLAYFQLPVMSALLNRS